MSRRPRPRVVVAGLGDTGVLVASRLARTCDVIGVTTRPALMSGQELGTRLTDPDRWRRTYLVPLRRFRKLDRIQVRHGRISSVDLEAKKVELALVDGGTAIEGYDALVIATGASNGFWRHDRLQGLDAIDRDLADTDARLRAASTIAVVGGGPTGVSAADNLARRGGATVHLFHGGDEPLPGYHPKARRWIAQRLRDDGVVVHPDHRADVPAGFTGDALTSDPIRWSTGQEPFEADVVLWAVGGVRPHSGFLPDDVLDDGGFVRVDEHLQVVGHPDVFAVGDVAATDPNRSSARNWGYRVVVANVRAVAGGKAPAKRFSAPANRWGSVLGVQDDGMVIVQPDGKRVRVPRWAADRLLMRGFVPWYLYGGLRRER